MTRDLNLKYINIDQFKKDLYSYYLEIFPKKERKPIKLIQSSYEKNYTKIIEILYNDEIVGFMTLNKIKEKGYEVLDYLAILPKYRNNNFGTQALKILLEQEKQNRGIFIEIEKVGLGKDENENIQRERRKKFYEKLGFRKLNFDLWLFDVIYMTYLFSNYYDDEDIIIDEILNIYKSISGEKRINENCKIIKNVY